MAESKSIIYKTCNRGENCLHPDGPVLPLDQFNKRKQSPDGHTYTCKICEKERAKESYQRRKVEGKLPKLTPEEKEARKQFYREYYQQNREKRRAYDEKYRKSKEGRAAMNEGHARRKERLKKQAGEPYKRWEVIEKDTVDGVLICGICGKPIERIRDMHLDHIIPVAQGGPDELSNVRCVHKECNLTRPKELQEDELNERLENTKRDDQ